MSHKLWINVSVFFSIPRLPPVIQQCDPSFVQFKRRSTAVFVEIGKYYFICKLCYNTILLKPPLSKKGLLHRKHNGVSLNQTTLI